MRVAEILRQLADKLEDIETNQVSPQQDTKSQTQSQEEPPLDTMVPPLQQKLELLKRSVGIDNVFDGTNIDKTDDHGGKELEIIKKHAGINPNTTAIMALSDDEPLDD